MYSLKELLKIRPNEDKDKYNEIVRRIFSNLLTPNNFPEMGNENSSIEYLVTFTNVPFPEKEILGLKIMKQLINWEWGMKALFNSSQSVSYILSRQHKDK